MVLTLNQHNEQIVALITFPNVTKLMPNLAQLRHLMRPQPNRNTMFKQTRKDNIHFNELEDKTATATDKKNIISKTAL